MDHSQQVFLWKVDMELLGQTEIEVYLVHKDHNPYHRWEPHASARLVVTRHTDIQVLP